MSLRSQIEDMPGEKQFAWATRLIITLALLGVGTISWGALEKLDRIAETQIAQGTKLDRLIVDDAARSVRVEQLYEMHYRAMSRIQALETRLDKQPD